MFILNISNFFTGFLLLIFTILVILLGKETKNSTIPGVVLIIYLILLISYIIEFMTLENINSNYSNILTSCLIVDFILILISYIGYLWIDNIESKAKNKKIVKELDWLWKKN